ncbi:hypothetical protein CJ030_MR1G009585 [Morella rubra]|uniref:Uncharacterized protein n=1 Tax=Morella rubra TaxID=262757 RepID=A0A6A1WR02_9ROSI|nr:hypothetical protein CJ030_MR1G009585 [Morella rubra]
MATTPAKRGRGKSRGVTFAKVQGNGKMPVSIPNGHRGTDGDESSRLATLIGTLVRMHAPFGTPTWAKVSNSIKEYIMERVLDDFELNYDRQEDRETVNSIMNMAFKNHKAKLHKHFKKFGERSRINTTNRAKLKVHHTGGSRPFVWHRKKLQDPEIGTPTAADLYSKTHHKKNGEGWVSDVARENYVMEYLKYVLDERLLGYLKYVLVERLWDMCFGVCQLRISGFIWRVCQKITRSNNLSNG